MTVRPKVLGRRVLLKPLEAAEATSLGIVMPDEVRGRESRGMVIAVGDDRDAPVDVGDVVVYAEHGSTPITHPVRVAIDNAESGHAESLLVVAYEDLLLVMEEVPTEART